MKYFSSVLHCRTKNISDYNDMADNKSYLESIARTFGYFWGEKKKFSVNTISQSPTMTTAGPRRKKDLMNSSNLPNMSPLGECNSK